jgi:hypothetical protein
MIHKMVATEIKQDQEYQDHIEFHVNILALCLRVGNNLIRINEYILSIQTKNTNYIHSKKICCF